MDDYYDDEDFDDYYDTDHEDVTMVKHEKGKPNVQQLFGLYDSEYFGAKAGAACILSVGKNSYHWIPNIGCHNSFGGLSTEERTAVYSSLWCRYEELYDAALDYWNYLLDPLYSPFKRCLKDVEIVRNKDGRPIAFGIHDMAAPTRLVLALMLQCRVPQENCNKLRSFAWWLKCGFSKAEALYLSELMYLHVNGTISAIGQTYHHSFDVTKPINIKRIKDGNPDIEGTEVGHYNYNTGKFDPTATKLIGTSNYYRPIDVMWETGGVPASRVIDELKGQPLYTGHFAKAFKAITGGNFHEAGLVSKEEAAKILMSNRSAWNMGVA